MTMKRTRWKGVVECSTLDKNTQGRKKSVATIQNSYTKKLTAKNQVRTKIIEYLSDPGNGFLPWNRLCTEVCHYKNSRYLYKLFTIEERRQIDWKGLEERRKNCAPQSAAVDYGLLKKAMSFDPAASKLWYQKMEGWSEKQLQDCLDEALWQKIALLFSVLGKMKSISNDERAKARRKALIEALGPALDGTEEIETKVK
jgi:hypothetical protein